MYDNGWEKIVRRCTLKGLLQMCGVDGGTDCIEFSGDLLFLAVVF